jgi:N-acetylmuramoyl-L-alanine amidase/type II secretory pathway predicted ATPase ExeA
MLVFLDFYHLREQPFGVTPDPAYLYPSRTHCEALDSLTEALLGDRGFLALIAEPGLGKTTLLNQVLEGLRDTARAAFLFQTQCNSREFFQYLLSDLGVNVSGMGLVDMHNKLNEILFAEMLAGRRFVLIVDEAQNLDDSVLETIRLLSNFETPTTKLLQIVLSGQPQLGEKLAQPHLAQLLQRLTMVKYLEALSPEETTGYIDHRLKVAGHSGDSLFDAESMALIAEHTRGVPRVINKLCFRSLLESYGRGLQAVPPEVVELAHRNMSLIPPARRIPLPVPTPITTLTTPPLSAPAPSSSPAAADSAKAASATPGLTYGPHKRFGLPAWGLWACAIVSVLASAGLTLPHNTLLDLKHRISDRLTDANNFAPPEQTRASQTQARAQSMVSSVTLQPQFVAVQGTPSVTSIQASSTLSDARVVVLLSNLVQFDSAHIVSPDRIYFDLHKAHLSPAVGQKTLPSETGLLRAVRASQFNDDVVRLVLDADGAKDYSAQLLPDPYRLIIEVHSQPKTASTVTATVAPSNRSWPNGPTQTGASYAPQLFLARALGLKINRIAIDPGHGGYDTGTKGPHGLLEKDLCLDIALRLGQLIDENIPGAEVVYTRKDDRHVSLEERTAIANDANADIFISIHANSSDFRDVRGVETYYLSIASSTPSSDLATRENASAQSSLHDLPDLVRKITRDERIAESKLLAVDIQNTLSQGLQLANGPEQNRGVKRAPFVVLTGAHMPAVLSEIAFVSNAHDETLLLETAQRQRVAEGLYRGIASYLDGMQGAPHAKQKLISENHPPASSGFRAPTAAPGRNSR